MRERYLFHVALPLRKITHNDVVNVYDSDLPSEFVSLDDDVRDAVAAIEIKRLLLWCEQVGCSMMHFELGDPALAKPLIAALQLPERGWKFDVAFSDVAAEAAAVSQVNVLEVTDSKGLRIQQNTSWDSVVVLLEANEVGELLTWLGRDPSGEPNVAQLILECSHDKGFMGELRDGPRTAYIWHPTLRPERFERGRTPFPLQLGDLPKWVDELDDIEHWNLLTQGLERLFEWIFQRSQPLQAKVWISRSEDRDVLRDLVGYAENKRNVWVGPLTQTNLTELLKTDPDNLEARDEWLRIEVGDTWDSVLVYVSDDELSDFLHFSEVGLAGPQTHTLNREPTAPSKDPLAQQHHRKHIPVVKEQYNDANGSKTTTTIGSSILIVIAWTLTVYWGITILPAIGVTGIMGAQIYAATRRRR